METIVLSMVGFLIVVVTFIAGYFVGRQGKGDRVKDWLEESGCYTCQEAYRYSVEGEIDDLIGS